MSSYDGRHAELYDLFYADKDYAGEARFVLDELEGAAQGPVARILDLACGTGRHALELERLGATVTGLDASASMLGVARRRAESAGSQVHFVEQDMRDFDVPGGLFDAVLCLFDSLGYLVTNEAIGDALGCVRAHLRPGGLFVCEFWHAPAMLCHYDPSRERRFERDGAEVVRVSETVLDVPSQTAAVTYTVLEQRADGRSESFRETQTNRFFQVQEMALLLAQAGLEPVSWRAGYDAEAAIDGDTWHIVVVARSMEAQA